jgi:hypothetical protein
MAKKNEKVEEALLKALDEVRWNLPDSPEKFKAFQCVQEAILWLNAGEIFKEQ